MRSGFARVKWLARKLLERLSSGLGPTGARVFAARSARIKIRVPEHKEIFRSKSCAVWRGIQKQGGAFLRRPKVNITPCTLAKRVAN